MGWLSDARDWVCDKVATAVDWVKDKLGRKSYSSSSIDDQIDVDKVLADFRDRIQGDVDKSETKCMNNISTLFENLKVKTRSKFPDLVEIIEKEQEKAKSELSGTVMQDVKEHLSKNDPKFLKVLEMQPGKAKTEALELEAERVIGEAENAFNGKLKQYAEHIMEEFTTRLNTRISNQDEQLKESIEKMQKLEKEANTGVIDVDSLRDSCAPVMESAECILHVLERVSD